MKAGPIFRYVYEKDRWGWVKIADLQLLFLCDIIWKEWKRRRSSIICKIFFL